MLPFEDGARNRLQRGTWLGEPKGLRENTGLFFSLKPLEIAKQGEIVQSILQKTLVPNRHVVSPAKALAPGERDLISLSSLLLARAPSFLGLAVVLGLCSTPLQPAQVPPGVSRMEVTAFSSSSVLFSPSTAPVCSTKQSCSSHRALSSKEMAFGGCRGRRRGGGCPVTYKGFWW